MRGAWIALAVTAVSAGSAHGDGAVYESISGGSAQVDARTMSATRGRLRLALGVRVGDVAVEGWLAAVGDDFLFIDCYGDECNAAAPPGLGEGGLTVRYLAPLAPHLTMNVHGDVARAGGWGALAGTAGNGLGAGAGLELSGKVAALRLLIPWVVYLWRPDLLRRRLPGPRVTVAVHADASARRYWMHDDGLDREAPTGDVPHAVRVLPLAGDLTVRDVSLGVALGAAF